MIRKVRYDELPDCLEIIHKSFITVAENFSLTKVNCPGHTSFMELEKLHNHWNWGWCMFGLFEHAQLIGYFSLSQKEDKTFELHNLAVLPEYRHRGYGKSMVDYAKNKVCELGGNQITIGIIDESTVLKNWYIEHGFISTGTQSFEHLPFTVAFMSCKVD